jgi:hypothetical protein
MLQLDGMGLDTLDPLKPLDPMSPPDGGFNCWWGTVLAPSESNAGAIAGASADAGTSAGGRAGNCNGNIGRAGAHSSGVSGGTVVTVLEGDHFDLDAKKHLDGEKFGAVWDRGAIVALPPHSHEEYVFTLTHCRIAPLLTIAIWFAGGPSYV